ncbi:MAG: phage major capsid protein [Gammaproteobacteria bacterium]|nr:phage major capsid protein [Gammaproteobacteria bacterium]
MAEHWKDVLGKASAMMEEVKAIMTDESADAETKARVPTMLAEVKDLKAKSLQLKEIALAAAELDQAVDEMQRETKAAPGGGAGPGEFKDWGDFLEATYWAGHRSPDLRRRDERLRFYKEEGEAGHEKKQMVESVGASGGFLVPTQFLAELQAVMAEDAIVRNRATVIRMNRRQLDIPVLDQTGTTASVPHWFGGMLAYWAEEATEKTVTTAQFRKVSLTAHKLIMYTRASDELLDDSAISLSDFLAGPMGFAGGIAWYEDYAFIQGTGAGQPLGIINAGATIPRARQSDGQIVYIDLANMLQDFLPSGRGIWIIAQNARSQIMQLQDPAGNYVWTPNAREGVPQTIFGMPVIFSEKTAALGVAGDCILADWRYYLIGDRQRTTVESTQYDYWRYDQTSWRAVHRVDGQPWLSAPLTLQDGTSQVSPFVILGNKSS